MTKKRKLNKKHVAITTIMVITICSLLSYILFSCFSHNPDTIEKEEKKKQHRDSNDRVSFVAVGDNIIHEKVFQYADKQKGTLNDGTYDFHGCYQNVKQYISDKDLAFINQETILGGEDLGISGYPAFNSPDCLADDLCDVGFNLVNGATNHAMDMSRKGLLHSCQVWRQKDVLYAGTYDSQEDRNTIRVIEKNGIKFSFLAYTFGVNEYSNYKTIKKQLDTYPYILATLDDATIKKDVAKAKEISDVVIVSAHWGIENSSTLGEQQKHFAQLFAMLDVDLVIGTHSHIIQPVQWLEGTNGHRTLVVYSLGNFLSTMKEKECQLEGMISLDFVKKDESIHIENIVYTPLVNHYNQDIVTVYALKNYTEKLAKQHTVLKDEQHIIESFKSQIKNVIDNQFKIDM